MGRWLEWRCAMKIVHVQSILKRGSRPGWKNRKRPCSYLKTAMWEGVAALAIIAILITVAAFWIGSIDR